MLSAKYGRFIARAKRGIHYWTRLAVRDFTEELVSRMAARKMNNAALAAEAKVSPAYVTKVLRGSENFTLETMNKLALAVGCHVRVRLASNAAEEIRVGTIARNTVTQVRNGTATGIYLIASGGRTIDIHPTEDAARAA